MRARREVKRDGHCVTVSNPSYYLRPMVHTASSKTCLVNSPQVTPEQETGLTHESGCGLESNSTSGNDKGPSMGPNLYVALAAAQFKLHNSDRNAKMLKLKQDQELRYSAVHG